VKAKEWLEKNNWSETYVDSELFAHHTMLSTIMDEYAKEYLASRLKMIAKQTETNLKSFI
jgi:hypothetical protein